MGHRGQIGDIGRAGDGLAEADAEHRSGGLELAGSEDLAQPDHLRLFVGDLDADGVLAGDRGDDADPFGAHRHGQVVGQSGDAADLDAGRQLHLVAGDDRAGVDFGHPRLDVEIGQLFLEHFGVGAQFILGDGFGRLLGQMEQAQRWKGVGAARFEGRHQFALLFLKLLLPPQLLPEGARRRRPRRQGHLDRRRSEFILFRDIDGQRPGDYRAFGVGGPEAPHRRLGLALEAAHLADILSDAHAQAGDAGGDVVVDLSERY